MDLNDKSPELYAVDQSATIVSPLGDFVPPRRVLPPQASPSVYAPQIVVQPSSTTVGQGAAVSFSVVARSPGGSPLSYQWFANQVAVPGATTAVYADVADADQVIWVDVSNSYGMAVSNLALLTVEGIAPPTILVQPTSHPLAIIGSPVGFSVTATGVNLEYQWVCNGSNVGTNSPALMVTAESPGSYTVVVSNLGGSTTSIPASLTIMPSTVIVTPPSDQTSYDGSQVTFSVVATGYNLAYQWYANGLYTGVTSSSYTTTAISANSGKQYEVVVTGGDGAWIELIATLTVQYTPTSITLQPQPLTVADGGEASFSVTATGESLAYQWYVGTTQITGATFATYSFTATSGESGNVYKVVVTGSGGVVTSTTAELTVTETETIITSQPQGSSITYGSQVTLSVSATGSGTLTYQWFNNSTGMSIPGATGSTYSVTPQSSTYYSVEVTGAGGMVASDIVQVVITVPALSSATLPDVTSGTVPYSVPVSFGEFPAGTYTVEYVSGAMNYSVGVDTWSIQNPNGLNDPLTGTADGIYILYDDGSSTVFGPGSRNQFPTVSEAQAANSGASVTFVHTGGSISLRLQDNPLSDNTNGYSVSGGSNPTFKLSASS